MLVSGLLQALYWIRQGGDFMHGRVLLTPVFCLLTPVAVIPVVLPDTVTFARDRATMLAGATVALWLGVVGWSLWAANSPGLGADATRVTYSGIVDERRFYSQATGHAHPLTAADYLDYPRMRAVLTAINNTPPTVRCCCRPGITTNGMWCPPTRRRLRRPVSRWTAGVAK